MEVDKAGRKTEATVSKKGNFFLNVISENTAERIIRGRKEGHDDYSVIQAGGKEFRISWIGAKII